MGACVCLPFVWFHWASWVCGLMPFGSLGNLSLWGLPCHILCLSLPSGIPFMCVCSASSRLRFVHHFLSPKHVIITGILKSLSTSPKSGSSVNLFHALIFSEFPYLSACHFWSRSKRRGSTNCRCCRGCALQGRDATIPLGGKGTGGRPQSNPGLSRGAEAASALPLACRQHPPELWPVGVFVP